MDTQFKRLIDMDNCEIENLLRKVVREELNEQKSNPLNQQHEEFIDIKAASALIKYSKVSIYRHVHNRTIPFEKVGEKKLLFRPADLIEWVKKAESEIVS
jgi:excisionase family DNA binding protein